MGDEFPDMFPDPLDDELEKPRGRPPYCDTEAEVKVLTAIIDPVTLGLIDRIARELEPAHFFSRLHAEIYRAALALNDAGQTPSVTAIKYWLEDHRLLGTPIFEQLGKLCDAPFDIHIEQNAQRIIDKHTLEQVARNCERTLSEIGTFAGSANEFVERYEATVSAIGTHNERRHQSLEVFSMHDMLANVAAALVAEAPVERCTTGIADLDADIGGLWQGSITIVAADTNWGKSNVAIMIADENLLRGKRVLVVSVEDPEQLYARRIATRRAGINSARLRDRKPESFELTRFFEVVRTAPKVPFFLRAIGAKVEVIASKIARICEKESIDLVIFDYMQAARLGRRTQDRRIEVNEIARILTDAIKNARAAGVLLSQIKRIGRHETRPTKHDLKESGDLENAAENVLLGYKKKGRYRLYADKGKDGTKEEYELEWDSNACCFKGGRLVEDQPETTSNGKSRYPAAASTS